MKPIAVLWICALPLLVWAEAVRGPTVFDAAKILIESGPEAGENAGAIFNAAATAHMRIPPEHLAVVFYDTRTGRELDSEEIRELAGAVRQDSATVLFEMAAALGGERMPMGQEQLRRLLDAAFIASLRHPPEHISIEFYDKRVGPAGEGGGVSGRIPPQLYRPGGS